MPFADCLLHGQLGIGNINNWGLIVSGRIASQTPNKVDNFTKWQTPSLSLCSQKKCIIFDRG